MKKIIFAALAVCSLATSCEDFLTKQNPNAIESEFFFTDETSLQLYTNGLIRNYMPSLIDWLSADKYSDTQSWDGKYLFYTDDFSQMDQTSWSWSTLRSINYYLGAMYTDATKASVDEAVLKHYEGVGRFFRALFYFDKMKMYGAVPIYTAVIDSEDKEALYKGRDARSAVAKQILEDLNFACTNCLTDSKYCTKSTLVNKYVALAMKSRFCLFEGTYRKYFDKDPSTGAEWSKDEKKEYETYLRECVNACDELMKSGKFGLIDVAANRQTQYRNIFICADACTSCAKEIIWARDYDESFNVANKSYSINDYMINAQHAQFAFNRDFVMTYLNLDGTPFTSKYEGEKYYNASFAEEMTGRDYRLTQTMRHPGFKRANGKTYAPDFVFSKTGYQPIKYLQNEINDEINSGTYSDVPYIRYAEILLNYAEAKFELNEFGDDVWNASIKLLRQRAGITNCDRPTSADPYMQKYFLGKVTDKDLLEIRRERGVELCMENLRHQDCRRWHMGELLVRQKTGMYIAEIEKDLDLDLDGSVDNIVSKVLTEKAGMSVLAINGDAGHILSEDTKGYIKPFTTYYKQYNWSEKKYLYPIPNVSVTMNENLGQNAGW